MSVFDSSSLEWENAMGPATVLCALVLAAAVVFSAGYLVMSTVEVSPGREALYSCCASMRATGLGKVFTTGDEQSRGFDGATACLRADDDSYVRVVLDSDGNPSEAVIGVFAGTADPALLTSDTVEAVACNGRLSEMSQALEAAGISIPTSELTVGSTRDFSDPDGTPYLYSASKVRIAGEKRELTYSMVNCGERTLVEVRCNLS